MSQIMKWQFKELFSNNKVKVIQLIISELIFLDDYIHEPESKKEKRLFKNVHKEIEKVLITQQKNIEKILSEKDYEIIISLLFRILNNIVDKIDIRFMI